MLTDALMKELGEEEWKRLSEQERQNKVLERKRLERRLRREGSCYIITPFLTLLVSRFPNG